MGLGEAASRNRGRSCLLLLLSTTAAIPGWVGVRGLGRKWRWTAADRRLADEISRYWVNFTKSGNPNGPGLPPWPAFTDTDTKVLYLGDPVTVGGVANVNSLTVLDGVYTAVRGKPFAAR